ncbi:MAG: hypothetical protein ABII24_01525 [bacterium]
MNNPILKLNGKCPTCNTPYEFQKLRILAEKDQSVLAYLECGNCATSILSLLQIGINGLQAHALITDLTADEVFERMDTEQIITSDEIIDFHSYLEGDLLLKEIFDDKI